MEKVISCCGVICSECEYFPEECPGCPEIKGKAFWLQFTGGDICNIYDCCINKKQYQHCGQCPALPCEFYRSANDPTKSEAENQVILKKQLQQLKNEVS